ncbi:hypothetical protein COHA_002695 [Chlorella ohadii]|uniref:THUMP domain-containing protein n=1 Tax=Chlorella ohadii TaxID=2649997 RepID=A0AAD5DT04_9CHLO|nr:hypothetical protein COHA_002695 [Chlorella ohadii]
MSGKRKGEGGRGGDGSRSKRKYVNRPAPSGSRPGMTVGSRGILAYEELGGTWKTRAGGAPAEAADDGGDAGGAPPTDIAAALASEVAELKEPAKQPFRWELVGVNSVVFLEARDKEGPSPTALVQHVCQQAAQTKVNRTKWCNRFYPVEQTCYASMDKIEELAAAVAAQHFPADAAEGIEFAVQYDARAAPPLDRMAVINAFATRIEVNKPHSVNLGAPQKTVLVNVLKSTLGVAVVEQFKELCRFNIRSVAMSDEEREVQRQQQGTAPAAPGAAEAKAKAAARKAAQEQGQQDGQQQQERQQQEEGQQQEQQAEGAVNEDAT